MKTFMALLMVVGLSGCVLDSQEDLYVKQCMPIKRQEHLDAVKQVQGYCVNDPTKFNCNWAKQVEKSYQNLTEHELRYECLRSIHLKQG